MAWDSPTWAMEGHRNKEVESGKWKNTGRTLCRLSMELNKNDMGCKFILLPITLIFQNSYLYEALSTMPD